MISFTSIPSWSFRYWKEINQETHALKEYPPKHIFQNSLRASQYTQTSRRTHRIRTIKFYDVPEFLSQPLSVKKPHRWATAEWRMCITKTTKIFWKSSSMDLFRCSQFKSNIPFLILKLCIWRLIISDT